MRYTTLGKTNISVSVIGFGAWAISGWMWGGANETESIRAINEAIDKGINLIDTAPAYGKGYSEEIIGKAIHNKRDKFIIATKCGLQWHINKGEFFFKFESGEKVYKFLSPKSIRYEIEQSLLRLKTDYIDVYQTHWQDEITPIEDTMETLMDLKKEGKIRSIGASNATLEQLEKYNQEGQLDIDQEKYNLIEKEIEKKNLLWCKKNKVTLFAYSPLAQGLLTGKVTLDREFNSDDLRKNDSRFSFENRIKINFILENDFKPLAQKYGLTLAQLSIAVLISQDKVVALCGIRNEKQAEENAKAGDHFIEEGDLIKIKRSIKTLDLYKNV